MENPDVMGAGVSQPNEGTFSAAKPTASNLNRQAACRAIGAGLVTQPDHREAAAILRERLGVPERTWLAASAIRSLPGETAWNLTSAAQRDLISAACIPANRVGVTPELEVERQRWAWVRWCRRTGGGLRR